MNFIESATPPLSGVPQYIVVQPKNNCCYEVHVWDTETNQYVITNFSGKKWVDVGNAWNQKCMFLVKESAFQFCQQFIEMRTPRKSEPKNEYFIPEVGPTDTEHTDMLKTSVITS